MKLFNVLDWMGDDADVLVAEFVKSHPKKAKGILVR